MQKPDGSGEFISKDLQDYLRTEGIVSQRALLATTECRSREAKPIPEGDGTLYVVEGGICTVLGRGDSDGNL